MLLSTSFPLCSWVHCIITPAYPAVTAAGLVLRDRVGQTEETLLRHLIGALEEMALREGGLGVPAAATSWCSGMVQGKEVLTLNNQSDLL